MTYKFNDIELRPDYQAPIHEAVINHMRQNKGKFVPAYVSASVGAGKTVNIAAIAAYVSNLGGRVLVLARQGELVEQNSKMAWKMGVKNSVYSASLDSKSTFYPVVFGSEGTVCRALNGDFKNMPFNVVLIDEVHHVSVLDAHEAVYNLDPEKEYTQYAQIIAHLYKLNPKMQLIGFTGSPYRGTISIKGDFWRECLYDVSTMWLVSRDYLVPPVFGFGAANHYDLSEFTPENPIGTSDYTAKQKQAMQRKITSDKSLTARIMEEVVEICANRGGVMITCAGKKHCEQVAEFLPPNSWAIITDKTSTKVRRQALIDARKGKIKYILQIGCLTTGVNVPSWDTSVILRRIGSLTLLTQLIGRILRVLEPEDIDNGFKKVDGLVLDYTDTFESFGDIYDDPLLEQARASKASKLNLTQDCPECGTANSEYAIRCIGSVDNEEGRCEYYFKFAMCYKCDTYNAPSAQTCRKCDAIMIDPALKLKGKHYTEADFKKVLAVEWSKAKTTDALCITYDLDNVITTNGIEKQEVAKEYFHPFSKEQYKKQRWHDFISKSIRAPRQARIAKSFRSIDDIIKNKALFDVPTHITHRINGEKYTSIINRRKYLSGREEKG